MKKSCSAALAAIAAMAMFAAASEAAPADVSVRIEGKAGTLFDRVVRTDGHDIKSASDSITRKCDGTNLGANPEPGPTATAASVDAMSINDTDFDAQWYDGFDDYFIQRWGPDAEDNGNGWWWGILVNREFTPVGGCQLQISTGDEVLWVYEAFNGRPFLSLEGPQRAVVGQPVEVAVTDFFDADYEGARVSGLTAAATPVAPSITVPGTTNATGTAMVTFNQTGWKRLKASDPGTGPIAEAVPSNSIDICVERVAGSGCTGAAPSRQPAQVGTPPAVEIVEPGPDPDPICDTDQSLCPSAPTCETEPALCPVKPETKSKVKFTVIDMGTRRIRRGGTSTVKVRIRNDGNADSAKVRVCLSTALAAPRSNGVRIKNGCRSFATFEAGEERSLNFKVKALRTLTGRGKIPLLLKATSNESPTLNKTLRLGLEK